MIFFVENLWLHNSLTFIYIYRLLKKDEDRSALAVFALDDALVSISALSATAGGLSILASSRTGVLHLYSYTKNGYVVSISNSTLS